MRKVLIAFDGSDSSKRALQYVIDFARAHATTLEVHLLNVQQKPMLYGEYMTTEIYAQAQESVQARAREVLQWPADQLQEAGITHKEHISLGNVAEQVSSVAQQLQCDTVVMGTRGLGSFTGLIMGSVATRVVHEVPVPVLLVK